MKISQIGSNMTECINKNARILVSYSTPVAAEVNGVMMRTNKFYSVTTSKHINKWLEGRACVQVNPDVIEALMG